MDAVVLCEESQAVTLALREKGIEAFSCDILPCSGGRPEWHIQGDAIGTTHTRTWDLIVSFPPCTDLSVSGARWFDKKRLSGEQRESIVFFLKIWELSNAVENPKNIMAGWKYIKRWYPDIAEWMRDIHFPIQPTQKIQPWEFGHKETKETWLWLKGLPVLQPTDIVGPPPKGKTKEEKLAIAREWNKVHRCPPGADRSVIRSKTYTGIAAAMASQWAHYSLMYKIPSY